MVSDFDTVCGVLLVSGAGLALPLFPYFSRFLTLCDGRLYSLLETRRLASFRRMVVSTGVITVRPFSKYAFGYAL